MKPVSLAQIALDVEGQLLGEPATGEVTSVTTDSRNLSGGELFIAIAGERVNGHDFVSGALADGAAGCLVEDTERALATGADPARLIAVGSTQDGLGRVARANLARIREVADPLVVGVTGSVGKTTTKDLLAGVLASRGDIIAPPGSFNNEIGLPLTVLRAEESTATLVLEMGADHVGNLEYLTSIAPLDIGVVLRVAHAHVGEFGGIDNVAKAKAELVAGIRPGGTAILNADDERVAAMASLIDNVVLFSAARQADVWASDVRDVEGRAHFTLNYGGEASEVRLGLVGIHHVTNALAAAAVGLVAGLPIDEVATSLTDRVAASPHRMDVWSAGQTIVIDDSYNANPESMAAGLRALASLGQGQTVAVLGAMLELGDESDEAHASMGRLAGELGIDQVVAVGAPALGEAARSAGCQVIEARSADDAWQAVESLTTVPGTILLKGSNGSRIWTLADRLKEALC